MFHYPYRANGDPSLNLLSTVYGASSSLPSPNENYLMHRNSITHSPAAHHHTRFNPDPASPACDPSKSARRVYSIDDIQGMNNLQAFSESYTQDSTAAAASFARHVRRYSTEERKERIQRYRSKRNHRNFHKKIIYACRKTLADSRTRVRGRFARNGEREAELETESTSETSFECYGRDTCDDNNDDDDDNNNNNGGRNRNNFESSGEDWLKQVQAVLATTEEEVECCYDEDIWASLDGVFSVSFLS